MCCQSQLYLKNRNLFLSRIHNTCTFHILIMKTDQGFKMPTYHLNGREANNFYIKRGYQKCYIKATKVDIDRYRLKSLGNIFCFTERHEL